MSSRVPAFALVYEEAYYVNDVPDLITKLKPYLLLGTLKKSLHATLSEVLVGDRRASTRTGRRNTKLGRLAIAITTSMSKR